MSHVRRLGESGGAATAASKMGCSLSDIGNAKINVVTVRVNLIAGMFADVHNEGYYAKCRFRTRRGGNRGAIRYAKGCGM